MTALLAGAGETFRDTVLSGPLLLAMPVALLAGLVSFLSPCVLPLVPGYLGYATGLSGADLATSTGPTPTSVRARGAGRMALGGLLFVLGFSVVFVSFGAVFGGVGRRLLVHQAGLTRVAGVLTILMGLVFSGVLSRVPFFSRDVRIRRLPAAGLAGAPLLGFVFGLGWAPCIGPTLAAVLTLAFSTGGAARGAFLSFVYCLGLGLPFILAGLALRRSLAAFAVVKRHYRAVMAAGGGFWWSSACFR